MVNSIPMRIPATGIGSDQMDLTLANLLDSYMLPDQKRSIEFSRPSRYSRFGTRYTRSWVPL